MEREKTKKPLILPSFVKKKQMGRGTRISIIVLKRGTKATVRNTRDDMKTPLKTSAIKKPLFPASTGNIRLIAI
jgi:hypothetical protein